METGKSLLQDTRNYSLESEALLRGELEPNETAGAGPKGRPGDVSFLGTVYVPKFPAGARANLVESNPS